jgi:acetylornithine deacetylase/succinyl-diaminopimelate desuccinylase-like protein
VLVTLRVSQPTLPYSAHPSGRELRAAAGALTATFVRPATLLRSGGTIGIACVLAEALRAPVILMGFALPGDRMHGPNEHFSLESLELGTDACVRFIGALEAAP